MMGGWLVLINSILLSLLMFMMSFSEVPEGIVKNEFLTSMFSGKTNNTRTSID